MVGHSWYARLALDVECVRRHIFRSEGRHVSYVCLVDHSNSCFDFDLGMEVGNDSPATSTSSANADLDDLLSADSRI